MSDTSGSPLESSTQPNDKTISMQSVKWSVSIPQELEEQLLLAGAALGCKGKSDLIATAIRFFLRDTGLFVSSWIEHKALIHSTHKAQIVQEAINLYKISDPSDPSL